MSVRVRKNSGNFISNGPFLLVWVTHRKFELEGLIQKLFTVKLRASTHCIMRQSDCCILYVARLCTSDLPFFTFCYVLLVDFLKYTLLKLCLSLRGLARYSVHTTSTLDQFWNITQKDRVFWVTKSRSYKKSNLEHHTSCITHHT